MERNPPLRTKNPCAGTRLPRKDDGVEDEMVFLERDEWALLPTHLVDQDARELADALPETGARRGEITALQPRDLVRRNVRPAIRIQRAWKRDEGGAAYLSAPTTKKARRTLVITSNSGQKLRRRAKGITPNDLLFQGPKGGRWDTWTFRSLRWLPAVEGARGGAHQGTARPRSTALARFLAHRCEGPPASHSGPPRTRVHHHDRRPLRPSARRLGRRSRGRCRLGHEPERISARTRPGCLTTVTPSPPGRGTGSPSGVASIRFRRQRQKPIPSITHPDWLRDAQGPVEREDRHPLRGLGARTSGRDRRAGITVTKSARPGSPWDEIMDRCRRPNQQPARFRTMPSSGVSARSVPPTSSTLPVMHSLLASTVLHCGSLLLARARRRFTTSPSSFPQHSTNWASPFILPAALAARKPPHEHSPPGCWPTS